MTVQDHAPSSVKETGTCQKIDAPLTQPGSPNVLEMAHRDLLVYRHKVGAESPQGRLLSNLIQQIRNYAIETDPVARGNLEWLMGWQVERLTK